MAKYLNTKAVHHPEAEKPCRTLPYCPYGSLVELFPIPEHPTALSCPVFGHDCPVHYHAEYLNEIASALNKGNEDETGT